MRALESRRQEFDLLAGGQRAVAESTGDDGAKARDGKDAVDRQARPADVAAWGGRVQDTLQLGDQLVQPLAGPRRTADDRRLGQDGAVEHVEQVGLDQLEPVLVLDGVGLGQGDNPAVDVEQVEDGQVLAGLGHDPFVGGDDKQGGVDAAHTGEHVLDKVFVAGDVDDADLLAARQGQPGKAQVDGHVPFFFFLEPVRVDTGQGVDQGGLAVIDVAGGAYYAQGLFLFGPLFEEVGYLTLPAAGVLGLDGDLAFQELPQGADLDLVLRQQFFDGDKVVNSFFVALGLLAPLMLPTQQLLFPALLVLILPLFELSLLALLGQALQLGGLGLFAADSILEALDRFDHLAVFLERLGKLADPDAKVVDPLDLVGYGGHRLGGLALDRFHLQELAVDELALRAAELGDQLTELSQAALLADGGVLNSLRPGVELFGALESLDRFLLQLGDALGILLAGVFEEGDGAHAVLCLLGNACDLLLEGQHRLTDALLLGLAQALLFLKAGQALKLTADLVDCARGVVALDGPHPLGLAGLVLVALFCLLEQQGDFVLELAQGSFELAEFEELGLQAGEASLQILDGTRLIGELPFLALDPLLKPN